MHLAQLTRDRIEKTGDLVDKFFDKIFNLMLKTKDAKCKLKAFEIMCNMVHTTSLRKKLSSNGYFRQAYSAMDINKIDSAVLEKLSWMTTLVCFHSDMIA